MQITHDLDMTMMLAIHDAFRRDLAVVAEMTAPSAGWQRFERLLELHHRAEDEALWPVLRAAPNVEPDDLALIDEMEAEHAALEASLARVDASLRDGDPAPAARAELRRLLEEHFEHEEAQALPLVDRTLDEAAWMKFGVDSAAMIGADMPVFLPWVLDGVDADRAHAVLGGLPEPVQRACRDEWQPAYVGRAAWGE